MALLKDGQIVDDIYLDVAELDAIPDTGAVLIGLQQWLENRDALADRGELLGIILRSDEKPELIRDDLDHFSVVALDFPVFRDGRAYSYARILRERYRYAGELRAVGEVLLEQLHFMQRVGFNSFAVSGNQALRDWEIAAADMTVWYQPGSDRRATATELRHHSEQAD